MKGKYITTQILIAAKNGGAKIETKKSNAPCNIIQQPASYLL